jgi:hypothetical protein
VTHSLSHKSLVQEDGTAQPCVASELIAQFQSGDNDPRTDDLIKDVTGTAYSGEYVDE